MVAGQIMFEVNIRGCDFDEGENIARTLEGEGIFQNVDYMSNTDYDFDELICDHLEYDGIPLTMLYLTSEDYEGENRPPSDGYEEQATIRFSVSENKNSEFDISFINLSEKLESMNELEKELTDRLDYDVSARIYHTGVV